MQKRRVSTLSRHAMSLLLAGFLLVGTTLATYALFITINTNDTVIDANWPASPFLTDPSGDVGSSNLDLTTVWVGSNASPPTEFYFRATLVAALTGDDTATAYLDCNNNNLFTDAADKIIDYVPGSDVVGVTNGNLSANTTLAATNGERVGTSYEWKTSTTNVGAVNWDTCRTSAGRINVKFETTNGAGGGFVTQDSTTARGFNVPTNVTLQSFGAQTGAPWALALLALALVAGSTFGLLRLRRDAGRSVSG